MTANEKKAPTSLGLLSGIIEQTPLKGMGLMPQLSQQDIVIELTADQLKSMLLQNADARAQTAVAIELHEGKLVLKIKLF